MFAEAQMNTHIINSVTTASGGNSRLLSHSEMS